MVGSRGVYRRLYVFEAVVLAHALLVAIVAVRDGFELTSTFGHDVLIQIAALTGQTIVGVAVRAGAEALRGRRRAFLRHVTTAGWLSDSARLILAGALTASTYSAIKLTVPLYHPRIFDRELWAIDGAIGLGYSPNVFILNLFSIPAALRFVDRAYASVFFCSLAIGVTFFLSDPSRRIRMAFMSASATLWLSGAWLYLLVPSLGPAFAFPDVWLPYRQYLTTTADMQLALLRNYRRVLAIGRGVHVPVSLMLGIGAFPSLHVGFQTFVFLWMRRLWTYGEIVFGVFTLIIFFGSMITGWHYLTDSLAGVILAILAYRLWTKPFRIRRWVSLRRTLARA